MGNKPRRKPHQVVNKSCSERFVQSYGAMTQLFSQFEEVEVLQFQALSRWFYNDGVGRIQFRFDFSSI